jgi:hypothetical protein
VDGRSGVSADPAGGERRGGDDPVPVDDDGMDIAWRSAITRGAFALLTPAHQSPLGVALSLAGAASCWHGRRSVTRGLLRMITIASFAIAASRCRR